MGSASGVRIWGYLEDPEGGFIKFVVKRASKQDQTLHMEVKLHVILYFREEWGRNLGSEYIHVCTQLVSFEITYILHAAIIEERPLNKSGYYCQVSCI